MSENSPVDDTQRAVDALVHRLRAWGVVDPEPKALEFITALRGQGWRPTLARAAEPWRPAQRAGTPANEEWKRVRDAVVARCRGPQLHVLTSEETADGGR